MKKYFRKNSRQIILFVIAVLLAGLVLAAGCRKERKEEVYDIVFLGDSIVGNVSGDISITQILEQRLGKSVYNGALGGTCMSFNNWDVWESKCAAQWSMVKLAQAIYGEDFRSQLAAVTYAEKYREINMLTLDYFYERILGLSQIDFSRVEVLIIEHGTNDYNSGQALDNPEDPLDEKCFAGALRSTLKMLQEKYPHMRILLVSPIYCEIRGETLQKCYETDFGAGTLDDFVQKEKEIAREYRVEWLDLYHGSGIWEENAENYLYDGLHPGDEGKILLGNLIADYLERESE